MGKYILTARYLIIIFLFFFVIEFLSRIFIWGVTGSVKAFNFGINNHHRWITLSQHFFGLAVVLCHKKTYDSWPVEVREIVNASIKKATDAQRKLAAAEEKEVLERFDLSNNENK